MRIAIDGNEAVARVAYAMSEFIAIYPITPSSAMGEYADKWAADGKMNLWGEVPRVVEMQSEGGAAGALHGAIQAGALATTFTASQGLLLMIPNMHKIAGELTPLVIHVAARSLAAQGLSIFGDHSDVMATRNTGFALLSSSTVQEAMDFALIAHAATLESRLPFLHFFDGFRTSHEISSIIPISSADMRELIHEDAVQAFRLRALSPDHPFIRGTAQNPDTYFQSRETVNPYYLAAPSIVQNVMDRLARFTGRKYGLFDYHGAPDAERVIVLMGSGAVTAQETADYLNNHGENVGVLTVHLYRPFSLDHFVEALPKTVRSIAVLDRTKEPGSVGEPLYLDVAAAITEAASGYSGFVSGTPRVIGGRYGLASKEFTPGMAHAVFNELQKLQPRNHFTIGIHDDVTHTSLDWDPTFNIEDPETNRCIFYGLGADGTVGANKNSIKIIGDESDNYAQGYFVYDSRKSGSMTVSHLRFGPNPIRAPYLITVAEFVACHQPSFLDRIDVLEHACEDGTFLLNTHHSAEEVWAHLPLTIQHHIVEKKLKFYVVDAYKIAGDCALGNRINTIMQTCFFAITGILPFEDALREIEEAIRGAYAKRGDEVIRRNIEAVAQARAALHQVSVPVAENAAFDIRSAVLAAAPEFVRDVTARMIAGHGDDIPVSALPVDGTYPSGTAKWEKRSIAQEIPVWDHALCIQCGKCVLICPHAAIRAKLAQPGALKDAPAGFQAVPARWREFKDESYTLQVSPGDCTGCTLCVEICPAHLKADTSHRALEMKPIEPLQAAQTANWNFFEGLPQANAAALNAGQTKDLQLLEPLFEFSGACAGCGETPYLKMLTQLYGDRLFVANATGCSSIFGGNLPTTPWSFNSEGRGPTWSNSLFEDNAEFGLGIRLAVDRHRTEARRLLAALSPLLGNELVDAILKADQSTPEGIHDQRERVATVKGKLIEAQTPLAPQIRRLLVLADDLVEKTVWIVGGDGWAYDIGYGGLDHVLASGENVNVLVLDTEVYSNTGGQRSKATPMGAVAPFAAEGKSTAKKDLGLMAMSYGNVYVARIAIGANDSHALRAIRDAVAYPGPSLVIAYAHCIAHGFDLACGLDQQKGAVNTGSWPLYRFDPRRRAEGKNPLELDNIPKFTPLADYMYKEDRFESLHRAHPDTAARLLAKAEEAIRERWKLYEHLASM